MACIHLHSRSLSDIAHSTAANKARASALFSTPKNPQRIPANTPPVFRGLRSRICPRLLRLVTNVNAGQAPRRSVVVAYRLMIATAFVVLMPYTVLAADELPKEAVLPMGMAGKAIQASLDACNKDGYRVSVSVVDRAGVLRAMARADGAGPHTVDSSRKKAYTAASLRRPTTELAELINKVPTMQALRELNDQVLMLGGGLPIEIGGEIVGGIGVGGAPGAHLDDACAQAGLDAIGAAPKIPAAK
jgi:uncharacterized protein GlcG (DUF336 family)